jgi:NADPH:quinone reductase
MSAPRTMRAAVVPRGGGPEVLKIADLPTPRVDPGHVLVRVEAAALNFRDTKLRRLPPPDASFPIVSGSDFAGEVAAVGPGVGGWRVGDRVVGAAPNGACAQYVAVHDRMVMPVAGELVSTLAATVPVSGLTASFALSSARVHAGDTVVVHAAAGGLGCYVGGLLAARGARSIGLTSTADKASVARAAGYDEVVVYRTTDPVTMVLELTDGRGASVVIDSVAGPQFARSFAMLANEGTVVLCGRSGGEPDLTMVTAELIDARRNRSLRELYLLTHIVDHLDDVPGRIAELAGLLATGAIRVPVECYPLDAIGEAHTALEQGRTVGKLVVEPWR